MIAPRVSNFIFVAMLVATLTAPSPRSAVAQGQVTLRVGASANDTSAEVYYAQDRGLFKRYNLDVQIQQFRNGAAQAAAVIGASLDIGEQNVLSEAVAPAHGIPLTYLAPAGEYVTATPTTLTIVAKASGIRSARDLAGKTIAVSALGDLTQVGTANWIDANGGDSKTVKFAEMPPSQAGLALERGVVDAATVPEPALTTYSATTRVLGKPYDGIAGRFIINGWFANSDWLKKNPDAARRFRLAIVEAGQWANSNRVASAEILARHSKASATVLRTMTRATYAERFEPSLIQPVIDVAVRYKALSKPFPAQELYETL